MGRRVFSEDFVEVLIDTLLPQMMLEFENMEIDELLVKVGISPVSTANAEANLNAVKANLKAAKANLKVAKSNLKAHDVQRQGARDFATEFAHLGKIKRLETVQYLDSFYDKIEQMPINRAANFFQIMTKGTTVAPNNTVKQVKKTVGK